MLLVELFDIKERTASDLGIRELINKADNELSGDAAKAITYFIGHKPGKIDNMDHDDEMAGFGIMDSISLESDEHTEEIEQAFLPVRNQLKKQLGNTVTLYRTQQEIKGDKKPRKYLSWTSDRQFARWHAGMRRKAKPLYSEQDIQRFEKELEQKGTTNITGSNYTLKKEHYKIYNVNNELVEFDSIDIYSNGEQITDTESVREFINGINEDRQEVIDDNTKRESRILKAEVSLDDVIWISDRAGQSEFIVRNKPGSSAYIDNMGHLS